MDLPLKDSEDVIQGRRRDTTDTRDVPRVAKLSRRGVKKGIERGCVTDPQEMMGRTGKAGLWVLVSPYK